MLPMISKINSISLRNETSQAGRAPDRPGGPGMLRRVVGHCAFSQPRLLLTETEYQSAQIMCLQGI
jgi:hypothetical protein